MTLKKMKGGRMLASELIKHLEEGGEIESREYENVDYDFLISGDLYLDYYLSLFQNPEQFQIVKPKKKIKLYRYTYWQNSSPHYYGQSDWLSVSWQECYLSKETYDLVSTETKEIEIDDTQDSHVHPQSNREDT